MSALDRVEIARGLPKHLKFYAAADALNLLFGVTVPDVPEDVTKRLVPGTWLRFLADTAEAAGHPVGSKAQTPRERDALAWKGMLLGFVDQLKADSGQLDAGTDLPKVVEAVVGRLQGEGASAPSAH